MLEVPCCAREEKEALILANMLKAGPFDPDGFRAKLASERARLAGLPAPTMDQAVHDAHRRKRYNAASWVFSVIDLGSCSVWPHMGSKLWAKGLVSKVAADIPVQAGMEDKLWQVKTTIRLSFADLPLIVFRRKRSASQFRIDDGCHRAVAYFVAGFRQAFAYVGTVADDLNHSWPWEG
jgi:hypothetical protein